MQTQYHIKRNDPCLPHWPNGSWSVYQIDGDQIAERIVREKVVNDENGAYYTGPVIARHSWCGFLGMTETLDGVRKLIWEDQAEQKKRRKVA